MEQWDIYDKERKLKDRTMLRGDEFKDGDYHLVVHVCIFNTKGEMLIQHRQPFKKGWSNLWDVTVGGSAVVGDNSQKAIERELFEEIGYSCDFSAERPYITVNYDKGFDDWYIIERDISIASLNLQYEEVQAVEWADQSKILCLIDEGKFIPYYPSFIEMLFQMKNQRGCIVKDSQT